jgi:ADP-heptose:LPS heptosyltransferase
MVALNNESLNNMKSVLEAEAESLALALKKSGSQDGRPIRRVLLHPGTSKMAVSKGIIKHWPTDNWLELIENLSNQSNESFQTQVVLAGGPDDKEVIEELVKALEAKKRDQSKRVGVLAGNSGSGVGVGNGEVEDGHEHANVNVADGNGSNHSAGGNLKLINMAGKTRGLSDLAALVSLCDLMVCVDSAPMHIGVGLKKKLVALFGPTEPEKLIPQSPDFAVLADRPNPENKAIAARHMFDGLGVKLEPEQVYKTTINLLR